MKDEVISMFEKARVKSLSEHDQGKAVGRQIKIDDDALNS